MKHPQHQQSQQSQPACTEAEAVLDVDTALRNALTLRQPQDGDGRYYYRRDQALQAPALSLPPSATPFIKISAGTCGAVFAQPQLPLAFKFSKITDHKVLRNDYLHHLQVSTEFTSAMPGVLVPEPHYFVPAGHKAWAETHSSLLTTASEFVNLPTSVLVSERIPPIPAHIRNLLIDKFCPESAKEAARNDPANNDCLIRVYLGSMLGKSKEARQLPVFSLRNFNLHLNQMIEIGLDYEVLAKRIGKAMALLHIRCSNDAGDVEFVLGGKPATGRFHIDLPIRPQREHDDDEVALWILDFNRVKGLQDPSVIPPETANNRAKGNRKARKAFSLAYCGLKVAGMVKAARENDPCCPRYGPPSQEQEHPPTEDERRAWKAFEEGYGEIENEGDDDDVLPSFKLEPQFLDDWEEVPRRLAAK